MVSIWNLNFETVFRVHVPLNFKETDASAPFQETREKTFWKRKTSLAGTNCGQTSPILSKTDVVSTLHLLI